MSLDATAISLYSGSLVGGAGYSNGTAHAINGMSSLFVALDITVSAATTLSIHPQWSPDGTDWYSLPAVDKILDGVITSNPLVISEPGSVAKISCPVINMPHNKGQIRLQIQAVGGNATVAAEGFMN